MRKLLLPSTVLAATLMFSPAYAASEWTTGCDRNGTVNSYRLQGSKPQKVCKGKHKPVSFLVEVQGVKFSKRVRELTAPGEALMIRLGAFSVFLEMDEAGACRLVLEPAVTSEPLSTVGATGTTALPPGPIELVSAAAGDVAGLIPLQEFLAADDQSFRTEDLKVVSDAEGPSCWGGGVFRWVSTPTRFHDPR